MAYTSFVPQTHIQESQDAKSFKIWDESEWNGESGLTSSCYIEITFINDDEETIIYDPYYLTDGITNANFNEYLDRDGHIVELINLTIDGVVAPIRFEDGYYIIKVVYSDGTYALGSEPYFDNYQAFLAKYRAMKRKVPPKIFSWPMTDEVYKANRDVFLLGLYLEAAENQVDLNKILQFRKTIALIKAIFDYYEITEIW
jgi:hypothetical protein